MFKFELIWITLGTDIQFEDTGNRIEHKIKKNGVIKNTVYKKIKIKTRLEVGRGDRRDEPGNNKKHQAVCLFFNKKTTL